ncbi:unnamed protein product [Orchesella dallaii]|uniref:Uncharacterized protein n=1 Tax=Orchesella dallaii TaxID=48710 RepID=A0ABP1RDK6_9HEXA
MQWFLVLSFMALLVTLVLSRNMIPNDDNEDKIDIQRTTEKGRKHPGPVLNESYHNRSSNKNTSDILTKVSNNDSQSSNILPDWGGNCTKKDWDKCSHLDRWVVSHYVDVKKPELGFKYHETDCTLAEVFCLKNGWTVTRCQLLCMQCNKGKENGLVEQLFTTRYPYIIMHKIALCYMRMYPHLFSDILKKYDKYVSKEGAC